MTVTACDAMVACVKQIWSIFKTKDINVVSLALIRRHADKVKNKHAGARAWVHRRLESADPGVVDRFRKSIKQHGTESEVYAHWEQLFLRHYDACECGHVTGAIFHSISEKTNDWVESSQ